MIEVSRGDMDVANLQRALDEIVVVQRCAEGVKSDRGIGVLHLPRQRFAKGSADTARSVYVPLVTANKKRREKGEALNMVPMRVADQQVAAEWSGFASGQ